MLPAGRLISKKLSVATDSTDVQVVDLEAAGGGVDGQFDDIEAADGFEDADVCAIDCRRTSRTDSFGTWRSLPSEVRTKINWGADEFAAEGVADNDGDGPKD